MMISTQTTNYDLYFSLISLSLFSHDLYQIMCPYCWRSRKEREIMKRNKIEMWIARDGFAQALEEACSVPHDGEPMVQLCRKLKDTWNLLIAWD